MQKNILISSFKIVLAAIGAIMVARLLHLEFAISAGIVAILTIQPTKRETVNTALGRLYAFAAALVVAFISFRILGVTLTAYFVYLAVFIFLCQICKWYSAMAMNSVLISHFVTFGVMNTETVANEVFIFMIGVSAGILANMYLRKRTDYAEQLMQEMDAQIVKILSRMSERILDKDISDYNGACFQVLAEQIEDARKVAEENYNNQFNPEDTFDMEYIAMRDKQRMVLYEMYKSVRSLDTSPITAKRISDFLKDMSEVFEKGNDGRTLMKEFLQMDEWMKSKPLPVERKEFEDRARLFALMRDMEEFIGIKVEFAENKLAGKS